MNENHETLLPGEELIRQGVLDLNRGHTTEFSVLALIAAPRLRRLGIIIPSGKASGMPYEYQLYEYLEDRIGARAYSRYNSLMRRIVSYASALEREHCRD